jgi:uncharacterized damage-inducible protein DinB
MTEIQRTSPPLTGSEAETVLAFLDYHRDTLRNKADGLDANGLAQRLEPSSMTLGGLLKHLAYVDDWWLNQVFAGNPAPEPWASVDWDADEDWDWHSAVDDTPENLRALYDASVATSRRIVAEALQAPEGLDAGAKRASRHHPDRRPSLRWVLLHLLEEYARHNGHADVLRESVDGVVGE